MFHATAGCKGQIFMDDTSLSHGKIKVRRDKIQIFGVWTKGGEAGGTQYGCARIQPPKQGHCFCVTCLIGVCNIFFHNY